MNESGPRGLLRLARRALTLPIWIYKKVISPFVPARCIYHPSCSTYAQQAILKHGLAGVLLALSRTLRCIGGLYKGGNDPVPDRFTFLYLFGSFRTFWSGFGDR